MDPESRRLKEEIDRSKNWKRWGPYLADRQWGTVREDYSPDGSCWDYFPHDHARSRVYRWGEDGLLGITDRECRLCFSLALWNGADPILKERLYGLTGPEGNHGEDVKECYYYLDATPTHSYLKALYKYPQRAYPYGVIKAENRKRNKNDPEFELHETGVFDESRYFDVVAEYAKAGPNDICIRFTAYNRGPEPAPIHLLPTIWFRNTWSWGRSGEGYTQRPTLKMVAPNRIEASHESLGQFYLAAQHTINEQPPSALFTNNETNGARLYGAVNNPPYVKDSFHQHIIHRNSEGINPLQEGTKAAFQYTQIVPPGGSYSIALRLFSAEEEPGKKFGDAFEHTLRTRIKEADEYHKKLTPPHLSPEEASVMRQAYAGLLWSKQFYHYSVKEWLEGDPSQPAPAETRKSVRNTEWQHLYNRDIISMPDKWEYPWYAAWDLAFHTIPLARIDPAFAKDQLILLLREWYMHPNGQIPAYEFAFSDVNPPVHAWACWRVYKMTGPKGGRDRHFLARMFHKLLLNFTWWINRKDLEGKNLFSGGFLGLDNIGVFDRSRPLPGGGHLDQADGTAWMAFYCGTMLSIALELAKEDPSYEDIASKFFEHFIAITDAINTFGGSGLWDEKDGFYYDQLHLPNDTIPLRIRSAVGMIPLFAVEVLEDETIETLSGFKKRMQWFTTHRADLARHISYLEHRGPGKHGRRLLAVPSRPRLERMLSYLLDENEFLSPYGIRSLSRIHRDKPYEFHIEGETSRVAYSPGESNTAMFGGNSNWRGPVWFPMNYLLIESLEKYHYFYGDGFTVEYPTGSGVRMTLGQVADALALRLSSLFLSGKDGARPCHGTEERYRSDPHWKDLVLFYEYFHGDTGRGAGASHQTGWTALITRCLEKIPPR